LSQTPAAICPIASSNPLITQIFPVLLMACTLPAVRAVLSHATNAIRIARVRL
jgi:hypothetical protein